MEVTEQLLNSINSAMFYSSNLASDYINNENAEDAMCILNEWTTKSGKCLLTHYINGELEDHMEESFIYVNLDREEWGEFIITE